MTTNAVCKFKSFKDARNYATKWTRAEKTGASFEMEASSINGNAVVTITKTKNYFMECQHKLQEYKSELDHLMERFDGDSVGNASKRVRLM
ncbi:hypothetical protein F442_12716 [Phytophthora nicotianae P10297]|uniref:Uncharacterized protein n=6 Tax=Phytophthora nicotianae TaxID=4792 RepID=W2PXM4_PHYN3|nr:hypothetical protein PPTG_14341 [Phytophthora nicotianae INRA-310]ETI42026.1 hypothetical protein F443_12804 [Phytophthora nicotianae P1569]ETK82035.1 hypothetical protein L915_12518 [Phytophthora nicotianae]ETO70600.1 hypothetical protein F444_12915 [Phytophthora nicotianae P1976]ETP39845.1 hypothetical protein F442_12716 [Phytophthora nicotianae P10297]ETL35441.1 hypothetical protein L916_12429 [Phytophthora nicotianae]